MTERYEKGQLIWVSPGSVNYSAAHVQLLLPYLYQMRIGCYPIDPRETGYTDTNWGELRKTAPYIQACEVAGELDSRLAKTGQDRYILEDFYCNGMELYKIARKLNLSEEKVGMKVSSSFSYISSGPCRRWLNCIDCLLYSKCRKKKRVSISYQEWKDNRRKQWR